MNYAQANFFSATLGYEIRLHQLKCENCKDRTTRSLIKCYEGKRVFDFVRGVENLINNYYIEFGDENVRAVVKNCSRPPEGWYCTREYDHDGPCAAIPKGSK